MLNRIIHFLYLVLIVTVIQLLPNVVAACPRCFGAGVDSPITHGISMAMLSLVLFTGGVMTGIILFFLKMRKRMKLYESGQLAVSEQGLLVNYENLEPNLDPHEVDSIVDKLLDKINLTGYNSLTLQEKATLENASKIKSGFYDGKGV